MARSLTIQEVAAFFQTTERTIRRWVADKGFPKPSKYAGATRFDPAKICAWMAQLGADPIEPDKLVRDAVAALAQSPPGTRSRHDTDVCSDQSEALANKTPSDERDIGKESTDFNQIAQAVLDAQEEREARRRWEKWFSEFRTPMLSFNELSLYSQSPSQPSGPPVVNRPIKRKE